jgi:hypothetical protein
MRVKSKDKIFGVRIFFLFFLESLSAVIFGTATVAWVQTKNFNPIIKKKTMMLPLFLAGGFTGVRLWEKLVGHYFNYIDYDIAHDFKINFESRYRLYEEEPKQENDFSIKQFKASSINLVNQGKNSNEASVLSQIRNLENIIYVNKEDLKKCSSILELQVLIDSATPKKNAETTNSKIGRLHKDLSAYKLLVENQKIFESEKEKLLGLPFQVIRHQQYPVPMKGTWQYDLFEEIFGHPYSYGIDEVEVEEKIHKFNYEKFLHPSLIKKYNDGKISKKITYKILNKINL